MQHSPENIVNQVFISPSPYPDTDNLNCLLSSYSVTEDSHVVNHVCCLIRAGCHRQGEGGRQAGGHQ